MNKLPAWMRITFKGRINRARFLGYPIGVGIILGIPILILAGIYGVKAVKAGAIPIIPHLIYLTLKTIGQIYYISLCIRRLHDLNRSSWLILILLPQIILALIFSPIEIIKSGLFYVIFFINASFFIYLLFSKGIDGSNKYGPDPLEYPNSYKHYLTALENSNPVSTDTRFDREEV